MRDLYFVTEPTNGSSSSGGSSGSNLYKCNICHSTYSHPGNFKQHLLKHEREKRGLSGDSNHLNSVLQSAFGKYQNILRLLLCPHWGIH